MVTTRDGAAWRRGAVALSCALAAAAWPGEAVAQPGEGAAATTAPPSAARAAPAAAQPLEPAAPAQGAPESAWSRGVSPESRRAADALFQEGNALLKESIFVSAAAKYREALARWDHPNIHFNLALALMNLDQPVETHDHLVAAMRHGPEPLQKDRYEHARNYLALLEKQLARVTIRCDVPGGQVALDGKPLFETPGAYDGLVRAGRHTVVASKEGFVTNQSARTFDGGTAVTLDLPLRTAEEMTRTERRWPEWIPWTVLGAGAAIAIGGGAMHYGAVQKVDWIDSQSQTLCPSGCATQPPELAEAQTQADRLQSASIVAYAVGGAAAVTGAVLVWLNRGHTTVLPYEGAPGAPPPKVAIAVAPILDPDRPGLVATLRF
jgi:PEGA domain-containing protein